MVFKIQETELVTSVMSHCSGEHELSPLSHVLTVHVFQMVLFGPV